MSTAALALLAAVAAVIVAGLVATMVLRSRRASEQRLDEGLLVIGERMDTLAQELAATVERMREDALRTRLVESLGQALDLDEVLARCAEAAAALHGVAGATVAVEVDGVPLSAAAGLAAGLAEHRDAWCRRRPSGRQPGPGGRDLLPLPRRGRRRDGDPLGDRDPTRERPRACSAS